MKPIKPIEFVKEQQQEYLEPDAEFSAMEFERYEIIEGVRYEMQPSPTVTHQQISASFFVMLYETCHTNATILYSPLDVYLDEDNQFQPDLIAIRHEREPIIKEKRIEGAPNLVVEILSPSTSQNDKIRKKRQYERFGVEEYWIADPVHLTIDQFIRSDDGKFTLLETYGANDTLTSPHLACVRIDVNRVFPRTLYKE